MRYSTYDVMNKKLCFRAFSELNRLKVKLLFCKHCLIEDLDQNGKRGVRGYAEGADPGAGHEERD